MGGAGAPSDGPVTADEERAIELLDAFWDGLAADSPGDRPTNDWLVGLSRIESGRLPVPRRSPYVAPGSRLGTDRIRRTLERHVDLDFDEMPDLCGRDATPRDG